MSFPDLIGIEGAKDARVHPSPENQSVTILEIVTIDYEGCMEGLECHSRKLKIAVPEPFFDYFAYGSCMCPVDLKRSLGEKTHAYIIGPATLHGYRLGFYFHFPRRNCGVLDIVKDPTSRVEGVLYRLPLRLSDRLDQREEGYRHEFVSVHQGDRVFTNVRTYTVAGGRSLREHAPNDWYFGVVMRGAVTCGLPEQYCWKLFNHMHRLQQDEGLRRSA